MGNEQMSFDVESYLEQNYKDLVPKLKAYAKNLFLGQRVFSGIEYIEDIIHEAFMSLRNHSDPNKIQNIIGWLKTVVRHNCHHYIEKHFNKQKRDRKFLDGLVLGCKDRDFSKLKESLSKVINTMGKPYSSALHSVYIIGLSQEEAAKRLKIKHSAFRMILTRARRKLKSIFEAFQSGDLI